MVVAFRAVALGLIIAALILLGADIITSLQSHELTARSLAAIWELVSPSSLLHFRQWAQNAIPAPGPSVVFALLSAWAWGVPGVLGVLIAFVVGRSQQAA